MCRASGVRESQPRLGAGLLWHGSRQGQAGSEERDREAEAVRVDVPAGRQRDREDVSRPYQLDFCALRRFREPVFRNRTSPIR